MWREDRLGAQKASVTSQVLPHTTLSLGLQAGLQATIPLLPLRSSMGLLRHMAASHRAPGTEQLWCQKAATAQASSQAHKGAKALMMKEPIHVSQKSLCQGLIFPEDKSFPSVTVLPNKLLALSYTWKRDPLVSCLAATHQSLALRKHIIFLAKIFVHQLKTLLTHQFPPRDSFGLCPPHASPGMS